ncbi:hypothetical protein ABZ471_37780 [Streptomyces sp. NPDC005728]|uniref:hypothetical protein n=1 Tax=Streptomyces sp. NPDC005728 TaxID=3157054 RepID=UPI0033C6DC1C
MLASGEDPAFPLRGSTEMATNDDWNHSWKALGDPEHDAYEAQRYIYALIGLDVAVEAEQQMVPAVERARRPLLRAQSVQLADRQLREQGEVLVRGQDGRSQTAPARQTQ